MPSICSAEDCDLPARGLGMCNKHYLRDRVKNVHKRLVVSGDKVCKKCNVRKPVDQFNKHATTEDGRCPACRDCNSKFHRELRKANPIYYKDLDLRRTYGISLQDYNDLFQKQNGVCAICSSPPKATKGRRKVLFVDHDHGTKKVRGLLCAKCNRGIGMLGDNIEGLEKALNYLRGEV